MRSPHDSRLVRGAPFFYGWVILFAGTFGAIMTGPGQTYAVSLFIESFITDLGLSRTTVSSLYSGGTLVSSMLMAGVGRQIDRRGPRTMVVGIALFFGVACVYMSSVRNVVMLGLGFFLLRLLGQGSLSLVSSNVINQWWVRRRGLVQGISGVAISLLGLGLFPTVINELIPRFGWRGTYVVLGIAQLALMAPLGWLLFRDRPELYGLTPDGDLPAVTTDAAVATAPVVEVNWALPEAVRTRAFWVVVFGQAVIAMLVTGLFFHAVSIFDDGGLSADVAAAAFVPVAATTAVLNIVGGYLLDRMPLRYLLAVALFGCAASLWLAQSLSTVTQATVYGMVVGLTMGLSRIGGSVVYANYFGRLHLGAISGVAFTAAVAGSALGPMPFGIVRDLTGSYTPALVGTALLPFFLGVLMWVTPPPVKPVAADNVI